MKAVALLSGGVDSAVAAATALADPMISEVHALAVDYGQRHRCELDAARAVAGVLGLASFREAKVALPWGGASLVDPAMAVARDRSRDERRAGLSPEYVPGRNTVLLALALSWADAIKAERLVVGWNAEDRAGFPDCRAEFGEAFDRVAALGTPTGPKVFAPLIGDGKGDIVRAGAEFGVPFGLTWSCYDPRGGAHCGRCDACRNRREGFRAAGVKDPTRYAEGGA